jgi:hypothetical protein
MGIPGNPPDCSTLSVCSGEAMAALEGRPGEHCLEHESPFRFFARKRHWGRIFRTENPDRQGQLLPRISFITQDPSPILRCKSKAALHFEAMTQVPDRLESAATKTGAARSRPDLNGARLLCPR